MNLITNPIVSLIMNLTKHVVLKIVQSRLGRREILRSVPLLRRYRTREGISSPPLPLSLPGQMDNSFSVSSPRVIGSKDPTGRL